MQTAASFLNPGGSGMISKGFGFRVMNRDLEILQYILEMKFSTLQEIHSKFFRVTKDGEISHSEWWARERVTGLVKAGYLQKVKTLSMKVFYVITMDGFYFLKSHFPFKTFCRPLLGVDIRTLDHDLLVQQSRIHLEQNGIAQSWISERALSEREEVKLYLPKEFRPDAIYTTSESQNIAFELERTRKEKSRYSEKVKRFVEVMRHKSMNQKPFEKAHFVCLKDSVAELLKQQTKIYGDLFKIQTSTEFFGTSN